MEEKLTKAQMKEQRKQERQVYEAKMQSEVSKGKIKKIFYWVVGIVVLIAGLWGLIYISNQPQQQQTPNIKIPQVSDSDISFGPKDAKITLVEYADFQCPACGYNYPLLKQLLKDNDGKIRYVYRFFPLTNVHKNAMISAQAGYAALLQGKFLEMEDILFTKQQDWSESTDALKIFDDYAKTLGLDVNKFNSDVNADSTKKFISAQEDAGITAGINSTPSIFINGKYITNPSTYEDFKKSVEDNSK